MLDITSENFFFNVITSENVDAEIREWGNKLESQKSTTNIDICVDEPIATPSVMSCRRDNHIHEY